MSLRAEERRTLTSVLDTILPPSADAGRAGAGELGLADHIEEILEQSPELLPVVRDGLAAAEAAAQTRGAADFTALPAVARQQVLEEISAGHPGLLPSLTFHGYVGYYQHTDVLQALGLPGRAPHPQGYEIEDSDLGLLDAVRARPKLYRQ